MSLKWIITFYFFLLSSSFSFGQKIIVKVDTVDIYKNKVGIPFRTYKKIWFPKPKGYCYVISKINEQDNLVINNNQSIRYYFKVYNSFNKLLFEGRQDSTGSLVGNIIYYRKNGRIKRNELWESRQIKDSNGTTKFKSEEPKLVEIKYFRRDSSIKKIFEYEIQVYSLSPLNYSITRNKYYYKKNGEMKNLWFSSGRSFYDL